MTKKWYNYIVSIEDDSAPTQDPSAKTGVQKSASQSIAEIAASVAAEPKFTNPISDPTSFDEIYRAAEILGPFSSCRHRAAFSGLLQAS